jgi:hypothetical protein
MIIERRSEGSLAPRRHEGHEEVFLKEVFRVSS